MTTAFSIPLNAIAAATHADPYPWYSKLRAGLPLFYDATLNLWIASNAMAVQAVLSHAHCAVRPGHEPVPFVISGSPAGEVFGHLVRMNDGMPHSRPKLALERALLTLDLNKAGERAAFHAQQYAIQGGSRHALASSLNDSIWHVPVITMAELLGFKQHQLRQVADWVGQFVCCLSPLSSAIQLASASDAAIELLRELSSLVDDSQAVPGQLLHEVLAHAASCHVNDRRAVLCNLVGLMSQTFEATAGLMGNTWVALLRQPALWQAFCCCVKTRKPWGCRCRCWWMRSAGLMALYKIPVVL